MSLTKIKYDVHARRGGLEPKTYKRATKEYADYLKIYYEELGYRVAFSMSQDEDKDLFGVGIYAE